MVRSIQADAIRRAVEELDHPSADQVFMHVRKTHQRVPLGTVYRNLDRLVQNGDLRVRQIGDQRRFDTQPEPHAHLHCVECDHLVDVPWEASGLSDIHNHAKKHGFKVEDHLLELQGLCREFQQVSTTTPPPHPK